MRSLTQPRRRKLGALDAIEFPASEGSPCIICLHGYGADAADLAPLAQKLDLVRPVRWIFPDAPHPIHPLATGKGWFPIPEKDIIRMQTEGTVLDFSGVRPAGLDETLTLVEDFIQSVGEPWDRIILGGFSQGAMMSLEASLRAPLPPRGLFMLSSTLVDEAAVRSLAPAKAGLRFFQSHGARDFLLGLPQATRLASVLKESGWRGEILTFNGGHELPMEVLEGLQRYLDSVLGDLESSH